MLLFERVRLGKRYDIAFMSSKGVSTTAARELVDQICGGLPSVPLLVLHDFDSAGIIIKDTLENDTRRFSYRSPPQVIDLGLHYDDIAGLPSEPNNSTISDERLAQAGLGQDAIAFWRNQRVELNAMTSRQLVDFVEAKLKQHGIKKVMPDGKTLAMTYQMFAASDRLSDAFDEMKKKLDDETAAPIQVPDDLEAKVKVKLEEMPDITWHRAVRLLVDPDAPEDEDDDAEPDDDLDDEDVGDIEA
jgi:hypothetical protein